MCTHSIQEISSLAGRSALSFPLLYPTSRVLALAPPTVPLQRLCSFSIFWKGYPGGPQCKPALFCERPTWELENCPAFQGLCKSVIHSTMGPSSTPKRNYRFLLSEASPVKWVICLSFNFSSVSQMITWDPVLCLLHSCDWNPGDKNANLCHGCR